MVQTTKALTLHHIYKFLLKNGKVRIVKRRKEDANKQAISNNTIVTNVLSGELNFLMLFR